MQISHLEMAGVRASSGQSRRFRNALRESGRARSTDIGRPLRLVRLVPTTLVAVLFDHLVGAG